MGSIPYKIALYDNYDSTIIVEEAGIEWMQFCSSSLGTIPFMWIDNENFIYSDYSYKNFIYTDYSYPVVHLRYVNIKSGINQTIGNIDSVPNALTNAYFYYDKRGDLIYKCAGGYYKIDFSGKKIEPYKFGNCGNQFEIELNGDSLGHTIKFNGSEIGKLWCNLLVETTPGFIAVEYGEVGSNLGYPKGIKVWNSSAGWTTIDIPWISDLIGWIRH
jgi:hypothetical protein